jgi:hypothetical protein
MLQRGALIRLTPTGAIVSNFSKGVDIYGVGFVNARRMSRRSGYRFADKDTRRYVNLERVPIRQERDALSSRVRPIWTWIRAAQTALLRRGRHVS